MKKEIFEFGDLVRLNAEEWEGQVGVVCQTITRGSLGHILTKLDCGLTGIPVALNDVRAPDEDDDGFVQLASALIALGSNVIAKKIITE